MKEQFADYETSKMLKELGMEEVCFASIDSESIIHPLQIDDYQELLFEQEISAYNDKPCVPSPLWQQVKQWLWDKHKIILEVDEVENGKIYCSVSKLNESYLFETEVSFSPITAEIEGIKAAVKYLHPHPKQQ